MFRKSLFMIIALLTTVASFAQKGKTSLAPSDFEKKYNGDDAAVLLDVRSAEEMQSGHIDGAGNLDFNSGQFEDALPGLDKSKSYYLYCLSGVRSGKAADLMREHGFKRVYTIEGGMRAWKESEMPVKDQP